jgi:hypothetical protein
VDEEKRFREGLHFDDPVTVELPAYVWHGAISEMAGQEIRGIDLGRVMYAVQKAMMHPRLINEYEADQQRAREEAARLRDMSRKQWGLDALEESDPRKEEAD